MGFSEYPFWCILIPNAYVSHDNFVDTNKII